MEQMPTLSGDGVVVRAWDDGDTAVVKAAGSDERALAFVARQNQRIVDAPAGPSR